MDGRTRYGFGGQPSIAPPALRDPAPARALAPVHGSGRVVVVDDDDAVRELVVHSLSRMGFRAQAASDADAAMELLAGDPSPVALAVVDVRLCGADGFELMGRMRGLRPELPVILMSGNCRADSHGQDVSSVPTRFLHKPFTLGALAAEVRSLTAA